MLNKISNIALQSNVSKENLSWTKHIRESSSLHESSIDSASFSPAMEFLKVLEWNNYKMEYPAKNKLSLKFTIEGLEFNTNFNTDTLDTLSIINYEVYKREISGECAAFFRVKLNRSGVTETPVKRKLKGLHELFQQISEYKNDISEELINESSFLNSIVSGIAQNINSDFSFINNSLIFFLTKLLKININKENLLYPSEEDFFVLLKVKIKKRE